MTDHEPDSYETGRTYSAAEISRSVKQQTTRHPGPTPAGRRLADQLGELLAQYERERIAERALAGDPNPTDTDPLAWVYAVAEQYSHHGDNPTEQSALLDSLADELTLNDARAIRLAAEIVAKATPRLIYLAAEKDKKTAPTIADELDMTESYVYRVLREQRAAQQ
ncbi:hypothetical protein KVH22_21750 [Streptomyces olivaceus]|uniref:hypothetical protein n=1 Tax=Streptomyces olivaceus TaxID=47716 RepID=UPI001CC9773F|nr:hypothetical protein [Streptomyces olivaceus]MBZ6258144.1 hypothetical protein [Streptomyces olivaceus]